MSVYSYFNATVKHFPPDSKEPVFTTYHSINDVARFHAFLYREFGNTWALYFKYSWKYRRYLYTVKNEDFKKK